MNIEENRFLISENRIFGPDFIQAIKDISKSITTEIVDGNTITNITIKPGVANLGNNDGESQSPFLEFFRMIALELSLPSEGSSSINTFDIDQLGNRSVSANSEEVLDFVRDITGRGVSIVNMNEPYLEITPLETGETIQSTNSDRTCREVQVNLRRVRLQAFLEARTLSDGIQPLPL